MRLLFSVFDKSGQMTLEATAQAMSGSHDRDIDVFMESLTRADVRPDTDSWMTQYIADALAGGVKEIPRDEFFARLRAIASGEIA